MAISFKTDQSGAAANICTTSSSVFNFSVSSNSTVNTGVFAMKRGSGSTGSVTATIYNQPGGVGSVVASTSVLAASISQTFADVIFTFPADTNITAGTSYSIKISSDTSCTGNAPYSFKPGNFQVIDDATNTVVNTGYGIAVDMLAETVVAATLAAKNVVTAEITSTTTMNADPSVLQYNTINKWRHDGALAGRIYRGSTRVRKAKRGNNTILDQPN